MVGEGLKYNRAQAGSALTRAPCVPEGPGGPRGPTGPAAPGFPLTP